MRTVIPLILELAVIPLILVFGQDPPSKRTSQFRTLGFGAGTEATVDASGNVKFYEMPHRAGDDSSAPVRTMMVCVAVCPAGIHVAPAASVAT